MGNGHSFDELCNKVRYCTRCERMEESARVLSRAAGPLDADVMFLGEAPGRLGADVTEIPFHGDQAGHNFEELLEFSGLTRARLYVTNAVLCNPKSNVGNNATPTRSEMKNCSPYLLEQIALVNPKIVVTLGATALEALRLIDDHKLQLGLHVRTIKEWHGRRLIPLYHPGSRAMLHRSMANQRSDYQFVAEQLRRLRTTSRKVTGMTARSTAVVVKSILSSRQRVSYFALHKILFLIEVESWKRFGKPMTKAFFIRQKNGPYCTDLHLSKLRRVIPNVLIYGPVDGPSVSLKQNDMFSQPEAHTLSSEETALVAELVEGTRTLTDAELKTRVYLSAPMRKLMRAERTQLINLYNCPIQLDA